MTLEGEASGASRAEIVNTATDQAAAYYGTECVIVALHSERCHTDTEHPDEYGGPTRRQTTFTTYTAGWIADIKHTPWGGSNISLECKMCGVLVPSRR